MTLDDGREGSIPAHAGEPPPPASRRRVASVYPRPRGGTPICESCRSGRAGLSPPTRGNPRFSPPRALSSRSIPAHAGEPGRQRERRGVSEVYPRPRGGTSSRSRASDWMEGLSPPTRGNRYLGGGGRHDCRSIPAHAGEPPSDSVPLSAVEVYPRPRGGTVSGAIRNSPPTGLSPPTRGNQGRREVRDLIVRSIPAHAGEPRRHSRAARRSRVYPRPRGGTMRQVKQKEGE